MPQPFSDPAFDGDLHLLVTIAVLTGQRGLVLPVGAIYDAWSTAYPRDALGAVGKGLALVGSGRFEEGFVLIEQAARTSETRAEQAESVLRSLEASMADAAT